MTRRSKKKARRRMLFLGLGSIMIIVIMTFSIGKYWIEIIGKYKEKKELNKELKKLREKEEQLKADADRLQNPDYVARYAREKYLYSKDGEYILQIPDE